MDLSTWIKLDLYNDVINLREKAGLLNQEGQIVITKEKAYFYNNEESFEVSLR